MSSPSPSPFPMVAAALFIALFFLLETCTPTVAQGVNITEVLSTFSEFSMFNDYLTKTHVAELISKEPASTVLAVANANASALSSLSMEALNYTLSAHVLVDYYDNWKLEETQQGEKLTTLYQKTGKAMNGEGFLMLAHTFKGTELAFVSANPNASGARSTIVRTLDRMPGKLSVFQVSNIIEIPSLAPHASAPSAPAAGNSSSNSSSSSSSSSSPAPAHGNGNGTAASPPSSTKSNSTSPASSPSRTPAQAPASSPPASSSNSSAPAPPPRSAQGPAASPPQHQPAAAPRKMLSPAPSSKPGKAPTPSSAAPTAATPAADGPGSAVTPAAADAPASPADAKSSGVTSGDHVQAIVMIVVTWAWFLVAMN